MDLTGRYILIAEDEQVVALDMAGTFERRGARVLGPAATLAAAIELLTGAPAVDGAVLDISLRDGLVFPLADALRERRIPYVFATGHDGAIVPALHRDAPRHQKPVDPEAVARALFP